MAALPLKIYELLTARLGAADAREVVTVLEASLDSIEERAKDVALQKKLEVKAELSNELVTKVEFKAEMSTVRAEMAALRADVKADIAKLQLEMEIKFNKLDRKFTILLLIVLFTIIFLNQNALEFLAKLLRILPQ